MKDEYFERYQIFSETISNTFNRVKNLDESANKNVKIPKNYFYCLKNKASKKPIIENLLTLKVNAFFSFLFTLLLSTIFSKIITKKLVTRIKRINNIANKIILSKNLNLQVPIENSKDEITKLALTFNSMIQSLKISQESLIESEKMREIAKLSAHVAHDIRSPLAAMEMSLNSSLPNLQEPQTKALRDAIQSIRDIANNLLSRYRDPSQEKNNLNAIKYDDGNISRYLLLFSIIETSLAQKKQEWNSNPCNIQFTTSENTKSIWILAAPNDIKRMISNLLNNAYESLKNERAITIHLSSDNTSIKLEISDTGHGIPADQINNALAGKSLKHNGEGIGLYSAKNYIESIHGQLKLSSCLNTGTTVTLTFPMTAQPTWFPSNITIPQNHLLIVLSDSPAIHNLWRYHAELMQKKSIHFLRSTDLINWYKDNPAENNKAVYFIDYELKNKHYNGLDLLMQLDISSHNYLITSHAEELETQQASERVGTWLIPKCLIEEIKMTFSG